jgi:hypothetical protein
MTDIRFVRFSLSLRVSTLFGEKSERRQRPQESPGRALAPPDGEEKG